MKKVLSLVALMAASVCSFGQRTEVSVQVGSGLFSYGGANSASETGIDIVNGPYVGNPYGRASGFSYSLMGQVQGIAKTNHIYGIQLGYEQLTSRVAITSIWGDFASSPATGRAELRNQYLNINPFIGRRFGTARFCLDATVGLDVGIGLVSKTSTELVSPSWPWIAGGESTRRIPDVDLRPRVNLTGYYRAFGLNVGFSRGLTNYMDRRYTGNASAYAQCWRVGLTYRLGRHS